MSFFTERYPVGIWVKVTDSESNSWEDGIKGLNKGHALFRASQNWDGFSFEVQGLMSSQELRFGVRN